MPKVSKGTIYRQRGTNNWSISFQLNGKNIRETTGMDDREAALSFLRRRIDEASQDRFVAVADRITFEEMHQLLLENYRYKQNRTNPSRHVMRLAESFGKLDGDQITEERIKQYARKRLEIDGMTPATLRRELAILKRMLRLAGSRLPRLPLVDMPRVDNARQGFFEEEQVEGLLPHLPPHARNLVEFLYPFKYHPRVEGVLRRQREQVSEWEREHSSLCPAVFHWRGHPIQKLRRSWQRACRLAGLQGRLLHDFRRTAVRNLIRAGVQQAIAMKITGHKTDSIFRRYLIVDEELLAQATGAVAEMLKGPER